MPAKQRFKTKYPGVYYIEGLAADGRLERIYYIMYRRHGRLIEEKAGRQYQDDMTPARAAHIRSQRIEGDQPSNQERREVAMQSQERWTLARLWEKYKRTRPDLKGLVTDENRFSLHIRPLLGGKEPGELTPLDIDRLRLKMLKTHKPGTVKNVLELLRRVINFAVKKHLCPGPGFVIEMPKVNNLKTEDLNPGATGGPAGGHRTRSQCTGRQFYEDGPIHRHEAGRAIQAAMA